MKILISTDTFLPRKDGVAISLSNIIPRLAKKHEIEVIAPDYKGKMPKMNAKITKIPLMNIMFGDFISKI